jgi:hypothetical protein
MLDGTPRWPTYREFRAARAKGLRDAVNRFGGAEKWAREMGVEGGERPRGPEVRWTDERIRATLEPFLEGRDRWPERRDFDAARLSGLREVLRRQGSTDRWAAEFGLPRRRRSTSTPRRRVTKYAKRSDWPLWTDDRIRRELRAFLQGRTQWPRYSDFVRHGLRPLYRAVFAHGGIERWAAEMRVVAPSVPGARYATEEEVRARLAGFLADRSSWPSRQAFAAAGESTLLAAVHRFGGVERWSAEFRLSRAGSRLWDDARIEQEIGPLVRDLGRWPTKGEFGRAGLKSALGAVYRHGGSARWQRHFGVRPLPCPHPVPDRTKRKPRGKGG